MPPAVTSQTLAAQLVVAGGSGTAADVAAIRPEIAKLPVEILTFLRDKGATVVACRRAVTEVEPKLRDDTPRGWKDLDPPRTWDDVPGTYLAKGRRVVVATTEAPGGGRMMPPKGIGHNSANLALHETLHGRHRLSKKLLKAKSFRKARNADFDRLPDYLKQEEIAGLEETYAESGARFYQRDPTLASDWPALFAFWSGLPIPAAAGGIFASLGLAAAAPAAPTGKAIGTAEMKDDGTIILDLRASKRGALGHALIVVGPDDPDYEQVRARHFPGAGGAGILASVVGGSRSVLIPPSGRD